MLAKATLYAKLASYMLFVLWGELRRSVRTALVQRQIRRQSSEVSTPRTRNIVIVGANFSGHHVAYILTSSLPPDSPYRVVVIEPNSHFQFTWVLPRLCVVKGHEHKAFIPYGGLVRDNPEGVLRWVTDRVASVTEKTVHLENSGEDIPYDILVIATGSGVDKGLPSRVNATDKLAGMKLMQELQQKIELAETVVVVGGGAAGVEIATDAKHLYPKKHVILVHSRDAVMHRFGKGLQKSALEGLQTLGVEVILNERVNDGGRENGAIVLRSGRKVSCDLVVSFDPKYRWYQLRSCNGHPTDGRWRVRLIARDKSRHPRSSRAWCRPPSPQVVTSRLRRLCRLMRLMYQMCTHVAMLPIRTRQIRMPALRCVKPPWLQRMSCS